MQFFLKLYEKIFKLNNIRKYKLLRKRYNIPNDFRFNGENITIYGDGLLYIGNNSYIGQSSRIQLDNSCKVNIGSNCRLSHNVSIYTSSPVADQNFNDVINLQYKKGDVSIGNGSWIGLNVYIGPGIEIGENCVIGANSVVTKNIPNNTIWGGNPALFIRKKK